MTTPGPTVLDALSLLAQVADDIAVKTVRDTHLAWAGRAHDAVRTSTRGASTVPELMHRGIAGAVYGGLGLGLQAAAKGLDKVAATGVGPRLEDTPRGRFVSSAVNGLIGDTLLEERPQMAIPMAVRHKGRDIEPTPEALEAAFPASSRTNGRLVVFLHGLCENESYWNLRREQAGPTYAEAMAERDWSPLLLRANTGLSVRHNGVALASLMQRLVDAWPVPVTRIALVGHSLGGLIVRAAGAVETEPPGSRRHWASLVRDVVTLGTPHLGAPIAWGIGHGSRAMARLPETAPFGRILDWRSVGVHDLVAGLAHDVPPLPHARYRLVAATLTRSRKHPIGHVVGDWLVRPRSAVGTDQQGRRLFPDGEVLHVGRTDHFGLLNHPQVHEAMARWLA